MDTMTHDKAILTPKIALYEPDIPQNTASIIRTCSCLGAQLEIIEPCGFLLTDKRFKRVVMDYIEEDKIKFYKNSAEFFKHKKNQRVILITTKAIKSYTEFFFYICFHFNFLFVLFVQPKLYQQTLQGLKIFYFLP